jgi:hypothetical protein
MYYIEKDYDELLLTDPRALLDDLRELISNSYHDTRQDLSDIDENFINQNLDKLKNMVVLTIKEIISEHKNHNISNEFITTLINQIIK